MLYEPLGASSEARRQFERLHRQGVQRKLWAALTGRSNSLLELADAQKANRVQTRYSGGLQTVRIGRIRGSEGRTQDFDANFRPLKLHVRERWMNIARCRSTDVPLPAVDLVHMDDVFFVRDGHHRISVARSLGQLEIEAEVTVWQSAQPPGVATNRAGAGTPSVAGLWKSPAVERPLADAGWLLL